MILSRRHLFGTAAAGGFAASLPGCSLPVRGPAVPLGKAASATVLGVPNERFFPMVSTAGLEREFVQAMVRQGRLRGTAMTPTPNQSTVNLLSVSGGGENGAFGAGLLCGWTAAGNRPKFDLVTGVSTGALIAPFAFLGADYDSVLRAVYTETPASNILKDRSLLAALFDDALSDNAPLHNTIIRSLDQKILAEIAKGYDEGRLLLIGSTDLDAQQPVIWNLGAIAKSGHPRAGETIWRILLASAAIPGAFPPVMLDVTVDGKPYQEMHVDGGAFAQAFLYPASITAQRRNRISHKEGIIPVTAYVIRNGRLDPEWAAVERRTMNIAGRAISTMIAASGMNDVMRMYNTTLRDDVGFNLAYIGKDFSMVLPAPFDQGYMRGLFDYGYQRGAKGYDWAKQPPI